MRQWQVGIQVHQIGLKNKSDFGLYYKGHHVQKLNHFDATPTLRPLGLQKFTLIDSQINTNNKNMEDSLPHNLCENVF